MDVNEVVRRAGEALGVGRAFGPAYEHDGALVIPVAVVAGGGGGGVRGEPQRDTTGAPGEEGGGFGGLVYPVGVYVVRDGSVRFVPSVDVTLMTVCGLLLFRLLLRGPVRWRTYRKVARRARRLLAASGAASGTVTAGAAGAPRREAP